MMSITLLNVSWKAEELIILALLLVQNLCCLPSLSLKIGLGLGFVFLFFVFCRALGICPRDVLVKDILCQHLVIGHTPVLSDSLRSTSSLPHSSPALGLWSNLEGFVSSPLCSFVWVGWRRLLVQYKAFVLVSNMRNRVYVFPRKTDVQGCSLCLWIVLLSPGHFVWLDQAQRNCNSDLISKVCFRGCIFHRSKIPMCSLLMSLEISGFS